MRRPRFPSRVGQVVLTLQVVAILVSSGANAQTTTGAISGRVADEQGLPLDAVAVRVESPNLQGVRVATTSASGDYIIPLLPPGIYAVTFESRGLQSRRDVVPLASGRTVRLDVVLRIGGVTERVDVTGTSSEIFTGTIRAATTFRQSLMAALPTNRTLDAALLLSPAVHPTGPFGAPSIAGAMSFESVFLVDGTTVNDTIRGQPLGLYIEDAIQWQLHALTNPRKLRRRGHDGTDRCNRAGVSGIQALRLDQSHGRSVRRPASSGECVDDVSGSPGVRLEPRSARTNLRRGSVRSSGIVDARPFVNNPGYVTPQGSSSQLYYYTARDAFRTETSYRTDIAINYARPILLRAQRLDLFTQAQIANVFNTFAVVNPGAIDTGVLDPVVAAARYQRFDPFTTAPVEGVNWARRPIFGTPFAVSAYNISRTFSLSFGVRF